LVSIIGLFDIMFALGAQTSADAQGLAMDMIHGALVMNFPFFWFLSCVTAMSPVTA